MCQLVFLTLIFSVAFILKSVLKLSAVNIDSIPNMSAYTVLHLLLHQER